MGNRSSHQFDGDVEISSPSRLIFYSFNIVEDDSLATSLKASANQDDHYDHILSFYDHHSATLSFLKAFISSHLRFVSDPSIIFRSHTQLCNLISRYIKRIALSYLQNTLRGPLSLILCMGDLEELNTMSRRSHQQDETLPFDFIQNHHFLLFQSLCQSFIDAIIHTPLPSNLVIVLQLIYQATLEVYPGYAMRAAMGSFLFHRFIVSAICMPERFGLEAGDAFTHPTLRRVFVLVSMVVQTLANGTSFSAKHNPFFLALNPWMVLNIHRFDTLLKGIVQHILPPTTFRYPRVNLHRYLAALDDIRTMITQEEASCGFIGSKTSMYNNCWIPPPERPSLEQLAWLAVIAAYPPEVITQCVESSIVQCHALWVLIHRQELAVKILLERYGIDPQSQEQFLNHD